MSKNKNLLNEGQVRQFMKLARLEPLTPGFVHGLTEKQGADDREDEHLGAKDGKEADKKQSEKDRRKEMRGARRAKGEAGDPVPTQEAQDLEETHGRGMNDPGYGADNTSPGRRVKVAEGEAGPGELEDFAADDLADDSLEGDEEAAHDELEADAELGDVADDGGRMVSVDDFLTALESALESAMGDEVEVDATEMEDEAPEEADFAPEGDEVVADMEMEDEVELEEGTFFGGNADKAREKLALGKKDSYAPDAEAGEKDYTPTPEEAAKARAHAKANPTSSRDKFPRRPSGGGGWKPVVQENTDALVEQVTKRVAARILKAALIKK